VVVIALDFSKAVDTVRHSNLFEEAVRSAYTIQRLQLAGITLQWSFVIYAVQDTVGDRRPFKKSLCWNYPRLRRS